jgi:hypothetical protein
MQNNLLHVLHSLLNTVLRAVLTIFLSAPIAGIVAAGVVEGISGLLTHQLPTLTTNLLALAFAFVVGYASALTLAVRESVKGGLFLARMVEHDFAKEFTTLGKATSQLDKRVLNRH